jgi:arabinan endo-1,5-alpha-L-arabinosidase
MYYVVSKLGTQTSEIGVATSTTMEPGSWTDHGVIGLPASSAYNRIDPNWITIDGKEYLQFGSYWEDLFQVELASPLQVSSASPHQLAYNASLNHREEASFMFQHGDYYYLLFSGGLAGSYTATDPPAGEEYRIHMCRSTSGTGDFVSAVHHNITKEPLTGFRAG